MAAGLQIRVWSNLSLVESATKKQTNRSGIATCPEHRRSFSLYTRGKRENEKLDKRHGSEAQIECAGGRKHK